MAKGERRKALGENPKLTDQDQSGTADASGTTTSAGPRGHDNLRRPEQTKKKN